MIETLNRPKERASRVKKRPLVAIKVQRRKYASQALEETEIHDSVDRAQEGARFIVRLFETTMHEGHVCQVFEKCGRTLADHIRSGPLALGEVKSIARQLMQGLRVLHGQGLVHTDLKPENLLWNKRTKETRLIDLGNAERRLKTGEAIATREYSPPEMLVGLPMGPAVDLWSLGCTMYELLTGEELFDPRAVCEGKYEEFGAGEDDDDDEEEEDSMGSLDEQDEEAEQLKAGTVIQGKYELLKRLGRGKFGTVWEACVMHDEPLGTVLPTKDEARVMAALAKRPPGPPSVGQFCIYEVALNYEHFVLMQRRCGAFPDHLAKRGQFAHILYDGSGVLRFGPELEPMPIWQDLAQKGGLTEEEAREAGAFLGRFLQLDAECRVTAEEALGLAWVDV